LDDITFRRLSRADFPLLARLLAEPHVARWWNHDVDPEALERDFGASADGAEPNEDWLVLLAGRPVGLIQYSRFDDYPEYRDELVPEFEVPTGAASIDYLLGDPALTGRGLGTAMIDAFVRRIWATAPDVPCLIVPVHADNVASWRALRSAGFRVLGEGDLAPDNPIDDRRHVALRIDRPPIEQP
jgi:aminoglycoside 6'-N-acetyltransferase